MEIRKYIDIIWRRALVILLTLVATVAVVAVATQRMARVYEASATLRVAASSTGSIQYSDYMYVDRLMNTYVKIATSGPVQAEVMKELGLTQPPVTKAEIIANTEFIRITAESDSPVMAAKIANTVAEVLTTQSSKLFVGGTKTLTDVLSEQMTLALGNLKEDQQAYQVLLAQTPSVPSRIAVAQQELELKQSNYSSLLRQYEDAKSRETIQAGMITTFEAAGVPASPAQPRVLLNLALGFIAGLVAGLGLALVFENLDTTLHSVEAIEAATKLPAMAKIPTATRAQLSDFLVGSSPLGEAFRGLATYIQAITHKPNKALLVVSAQPDQGKSMITFRLACALAELGKSVIAVDCDTRRPVLHSLFHLPNELGLQDVLEQDAKLEDVLQKSPFEGVQLLSSGSRQLAHPSQMLGSAKMERLIESLSQKCDYILLDSPALVAVADVEALTPHVDGLMLVVRQGRAKNEAVQAAAAFLARNSGKSAMLIVNQAKIVGGYGYYAQSRKNRLFPGLTKGLLKGKPQS